MPLYRESGNVWKMGMHCKREARAQYEYSRREAELFLIVPFLGDHAGPHGVGKRSPRLVAYECRGNGTLPDLAPFSDLDFFIAPPDLDWTMLHTHEDYTLGGPYFIDKSWLVPRIRDRGFNG
jgi:hypothetical protein